jgi:uncharacterized protein YukE
VGVEALPGGGKLAELIEKVTADPGAISAIAQRWRSAGGVADSSGQALSSTVRGVDDAWQGPAADSFVSYLTGFTSLCGDTKAQLDSAASTLDQAAQLLESTRRTVVNRCDALVSEAAVARSRMPEGTPPADADAAIAALVDQVYSELKPVVDDADAQLSGLAGRLTPAAGGGFGAYPEPGTARFVPQPGQPIAWQPQQTDVPTGTHGASTTSSAPGGGSSGFSGGGHGFAGYGPSGPPPAGGGPAPQGQVADWIRQAIEILRAQGYPVDKMNPNDIWMIIQHESGGNPNAINNWDSNAARGTPSKGLMQTIDPTFNRWALPGHTNIYNPVDNIIAGVRYAIERYGSVSNVPGVVGVKTGGGYRGY